MWAIKKLSLLAPLAVPLSPLLALWLGHSCCTCFNWCKGAKLLANRDFLTPTADVLGEHGPGRSGDDFKGGPGVVDALQHAVELALASADHLVDVSSD